MSNFKCVKDFNRAFDMVSKEPKDYIGYDEDVNNLIKINPLKFCRVNVFESQSLIRLRLNLIKEEIEELNEAIKVNDMKETRDAIGDILYVVYGMADILGMDIDYIFSNSLQDEVIKYYLDKNKKEEGEKEDKKEDKKYINTIFIDKIIQASENGNKKITNFYYVKTFIDELMGNENSISHNPNSIHKPNFKYVLNKINALYLKLEKECENDIMINAIYGTDKIDKIDKDTMLKNKFLSVSQIIYNLLKMTYTLAHIYDINADSDFAIIHESNMSKLCDTEQDAKDTVSDYEIKYKAGKSPYDSPYYYELPELKKWIVKNKSSGKALKNIKYKTVVF